MPIYTRHGDAGTSQLFNGERRSKADMVFEVLGNIDELSASIGMVCESIQSSNPAEYTFLTVVLSRLLDCGSIIATPPSTTKNKHKLARVYVDFDEICQELEIRIDYMDKNLAPLKNFILPVKSSQIHLARTICRRTERAIIFLKEHSQTNDVPTGILKLFNRLSDYLFTLARFESRNEDEIIYCKAKTK